MRGPFTPIRSDRAATSRETATPKPSSLSKSESGFHVCLLPSSQKCVTVQHSECGLSSCLTSLCGPPCEQDSCYNIEQDGFTKFKVCRQFGVKSEKSRESQSSDILPAGFNPPTFRNTCQVRSLLILQGGPVVCSPPALFFYYQQLQGASAGRAEGHRGVTAGVCESSPSGRVCVGA